MTNEAGAVAPINGHFRPESISHFKEVAKNLAWLLDRPLHQCQEDLARIYGYSGLHELQQVLKNQGNPGPFDPRNDYLDTDYETLVTSRERRIFFTLFGVRKGYWRDYQLANDRSFLVFEMGLFQEAAEHRACFEKIRLVLSYRVGFDNWPLIHGWPLGLKSWLVSRYTEPFELAEGWARMLPESQWEPIERADIRWQSRMTGLMRLPAIFQILAPRVGEKKPREIRAVAFDLLEDPEGEYGFNDVSGGGYHLNEWLTKKLSRKTGELTQLQQDQIDAFVQRPSRATSASCEVIKDLSDPVGFRDRWTFECIKVALDKSPTIEKGLYSSILDEGIIHSLALLMDADSAAISADGGCQIWRLHCTHSQVMEVEKEGGWPILQPVIHANGALITPYDEDWVGMSDVAWYLSHDDSEFAQESAAVVFDEIYLPSIGVKRLDFAYLKEAYSIVEIEEILIAPTVNVDALKSYFERFLRHFDDGYLPDSFGNWCETLSLTYEDKDENSLRNEDSEYADYVATPSVLLINIRGCGLTFVEATHQNGEHVSILKRNAKKKSTPSGKALANMVMEAVKGLDVDVVVYDGTH